MERYNLLEIDVSCPRTLYSLPIRNVLRLVRIPRGAYQVKVRADMRGACTSVGF